ncbi:MAG: 50S ribosomal protein L21 [Bacteroidetes bacterium]|jgi:large subunit ribosomal protein L21|nr:50S ribosomal protein L21 [Bacteroidota bacterium]MBT4408471.1 50S ribosomal protein L21 [Bacteroidota bacterium]MBT5426816.1 50S ribosomal protein L21 [Bacteroidota bacterium]MBT7092959.1 50S ribosomal protein L21 [Bacteroidota bacterium]MBT7465394.1 50S ribosomal protein L21 [Bacteroidota bacterium]
MYAIVEIAGQQFKVEKDQKIFVHRLEQEEGAQVDFEKVLLLDNDGKIKVGTPVIKGAKISCKVLGHPRGDKVKVFKKKRRKGYQTLNGHRQDFTQIQIEDILLG